MQTPDVHDADPEDLARFFETKLQAECDVTTVIEMLDEGREDFTLVDLRDPETFAEGHVEGAINIPAAELDERMDELDPDEPVYLYCYDHECYLSVEAAYHLASEGFQVRDVIGGWEMFEAKGAPVAEGGPEEAKAAPAV